MSRRRGNANSITTIYWRDIPAQVIASAGGVTHKALLAPRFQHAIDRAAAVAGLTETEAYVAQWRRVSEPIVANPEAAASEVAAGLDADYPRARLERLVAAGGSVTGTEQKTTIDQTGGTAP